ncbi:MAG: hypothetical protein M5U19_13130 [Microthrixaceae bacterium]|nr:hypothetical protein [Microthrixaceae bacterium]
MRRDRQGKEPEALARLAVRVPALLDEIQQSMLDEATAKRDSATVEVADAAEALEAAQHGFARIPWSALGEQGEARLAESAVTVRCLQDRDLGVPADIDCDGVTALVARSY